MTLNFTVDFNYRWEQDNDFDWNDLKEELRNILDEIVINQNIEGQARQEIAFYAEKVSEKGYEYDPDDFTVRINF